MNEFMSDRVQCMVKRLQNLVLSTKAQYKKTRITQQTCMHFNVIEYGCHCRSLASVQQLNGIKTCIGSTALQPCQGFNGYR